MTPTDLTSAASVARLGVRLTVMSLDVQISTFIFCCLMALVRREWAPLIAADVRIANALNRYLNDHVAHVMPWSMLSAALGPTPLRVLVVLASAALHRRGASTRAKLLLGATTGAGLLTTSLKSAIDRRRPVVPLPVRHASGGSFPSSHALTSVVVIGVGAAIVPARPAVRRVIVGAGAVTVVGVGISRLALGVHYLSDVIAGWSLGVAWSLVVLRAFRRTLPARSN
jgi:membrane-associated phospholipid phosphatase